MHQPPFDPPTEEPQPLSALDSAYLAAAKNGELQPLKAYIAQGADIHAVDPATGANALMLAAVRRGEQRSSVILHLLEVGVRPDVPELDGYTALMRLADSYQNEGLKRVLEGGLDPDYAAPFTKVTGLHRASAVNNEEGVRILLAGGANPNVANLSGETPLHYASSGPIVDLLLDAGAAIDTLNNLGDTPLSASISDRSAFGIVQRLVLRGADVNTGGRLKPIHKAVIYDRDDVFSLLLSAGANVDAMTESGKSVDALFEEWGVGEQCKALIAAHRAKQSIQQVIAVAKRSARPQ